MRFPRILFHSVISEVRLALWRWLLLEKESAGEDRILKALGTSAVIAGGEPQRLAEQNFTLVKSLLEQYPCWRRGHAVVGEIALENGDFPLALASASAVELLGGTALTWPRLVRSECALKQGALDDAERGFDALMRSGCSQPRVLEGLGAVYIARGEFERAENILSRISPEVRSAPTEAALRFAKRARNLSSGVSHGAP